MSKEDYTGHSWKLIFHEPFYSNFIRIFIAYIVVNLLLCWLFSSLQLFSVYSLEIQVIPFIFAVLLSLSISFFVAFNSVQAYINYISHEKYIIGIILTVIGAIIGILAGFCPLSIAGLFPIIFDLFGFTIEFQEFPMLGMEIQLGVLVLLAIGSFILNKD